MTTPLSLFEQVGGIEGIQRVVRAYIHEVKTAPEAARLRGLYREDMSHYEQRMIEFLSGWLGGPALYLQRHGMPMLRETHRNFGIDESIRDEWMFCMRTALEKTIEDADLRLKLEGAFWRMCDSLRR